MLAQQVGHAGNATSMCMNRFDRERSKDFFSVVTGDTKSFEDISRRLLLREGQCFGAQRDALTKLPKIPAIQFLLEFGLTGQHNLEELFGGSLEVGQQPDFFKHLPGEILRLIDD